MAANSIQSSAPASLATDTRSLDVLRGRAARDPQGAVKAAAKQFEALFMNELMKSMRSSTLASGMLDSEGGKLGTEMLDKQYADQMTGLPGGLSEVIARQLERQMGLPPAPSAGRGSANPESTPASGGMPDPRANAVNAPDAEQLGHAINNSLRMRLSTP